MALTLYFAYGSNLSNARMSYRCPAARPFCKAELRGYRLTFCENSSGTGVCNIVPSKNGKVQGFLYMVTPKCMAALDMYEGAPYVYDRVMTAVRAGDETIHCFTYAMVGTTYTAMPTERYFNIVYQGYTDKGLDRERLSKALIDLKPSKRGRKRKDEDFPLLGLS